MGVQNGTLVSRKIDYHLLEDSCLLLMHRHHGPGGRLVRDNPMGAGIPGRKLVRDSFSQNWLPSYFLHGPGLGPNFVRA